MFSFLRITIFILLLFSPLFLGIHCRHNGHRKRHLEFTSTTVDPDEDDDFDLRADDDDRVYKNPRNFPSTQCPRDDEYALLLGQKCLRKCYSDEDCKSKKKRCLCDGLCGMSCVKPERECEELASPSHGSVTVRGTLFSDRANYTCDFGYTLIGSVSRKCQADGKWSGVIPVCKQTATCNAPVVIPSARHNGPPDQVAFEIDYSIKYECTSGFITNGFPTAKCLEVDGTASWFGPDISCEPRSCGTPVEIPNSWHTGDCLTFGCKITYHCEEGYEIVGRNEKTCQADGIWAPREIPTCVLVTAVQCPIPEHPLFGTATYTSTSYNSVVSYECKYGYHLSGDITRRCGADRKWTGVTPKCQEINCGPLGKLYNGWIENVEAGTKLGASVIFRCDSGMLLQGNTSTVCQSDATWRYPLPLCLAPCVVPRVQEGKLYAPIVETSENTTGNYSTMFVMDPVIVLEATVVQHGTSLITKCTPRFELTNYNRLVTCNNGTWSYIPKCQPARCKHLPTSPKNGLVLTPKVDHGARARYKCTDGYKIVGDKITECRYGNWTGETPKCEEVYCSYPGAIENGKVLLVGSMGLYDYRPYVRRTPTDKQVVYECDKGYVLDDKGPVGATCIDGRWSPKKLPQCFPSRHPQVRLSRSVHEEYENVTSENFGNSTTPNIGRYKRALSGQNSQQVMRTKQQTSSKDPKEKASGSGSSRSRNRGQAGDDDVDFKDYDEEVMVEPKKKPKGKKKHLGKKKVVVCSAISKEPYVHLEVVKVGRLSNVTHSHGTIVRVICAQGYKLNIGTNTTAKCSRGRWKPEKPQCEVVPCYVNPNPYGVYTRVTEITQLLDSEITPETEFYNRDVVSFECNEGFNIKGPSVFKCELGEWNVSALPECTPAPCELPMIMHGQYQSGYRSGLTIANGSFVSYQCDHEFVKVTSLHIQCYHGEFIPKKPACRRDGSLYQPGSHILRSTDLGTIDLLNGLRGSCGPPARILGSNVMRNGQALPENERSFPDGTEITFTCVEYIREEKLTWKIVCFDGSWIGRSLSCDAEDFVETNTIARDNSTCTFRNTEPNVSTFNGDQLITDPVVEFFAGTVLTFRCVDIGKYSMEGSTHRRCADGEWDGEKPVCFGLNQENAYALEKAPTILFRHEQGPIAQSNDGKMIVYPGTILHMECLWIRRFGTPKWSVSHTYRNYPEGWTTDPARDNQLEYRLSIYHASQDDSGVFTCTTPTRHIHSVEIVVKGVHCESLHTKNGALIISTRETKMNTRVEYSCYDGYRLEGATEGVCLPSGNWSTPMPFCEAIQCPPITDLEVSHLRMVILNNTVGGEAFFKCMQGYGMQGPTRTVCLPNGEWESPLPTCTGLQSCSYPGTVISGRMSSVKFYYSVGETISFKCENGLILQGSPVLHCLPTGKWTRSVPVCIPPIPENMTYSSTWQT